MSTFKRPKDPDADLDYAICWASKERANDGGRDDDGWLQGEEIASSQWIVDGPDNALITHDEAVGDTLGFDSEGSPITLSTNTRAVVWARGGTLGEEYRLINRIITNGSPPRKDDRTLLIKVQER
ncbi:MAG: hypothetical protein Hals2KO_21500 [Halioglobus sp.]